MKRWNFVVRYAIYALLAGAVWGVALPLTAAEDDTLPWLILWNLQEKSGKVIVMTDEDLNAVYTITLPVTKGVYTYRVAIGPNKQPIYGEGGKKGGKPVKIEVDDNRMVTFFYDSRTHDIAAEIGETFIPPRRVVLVGNLQDEFGHTGGPFGGEWDPAAETTLMQRVDDDLYLFSGTLPAGAYEYKVAIGGSWKENYGQGGKQDGPNIVVTVEEEGEVTFYYNDLTHKIADSTWYRMLPEDERPRIAGDLERAAVGELVMTDDDFDQVYSMRLFLPKGVYSYRIALGADEQVVYGANAEQDGPPVEFTLTENREVALFFDWNTHQTFFDAGSIADEMLKHDTYNLVFRSPFEALQTGQELTLSLHARKGDITSATLVIGKADIIKGQRRYGTSPREYALTYLETREIQGFGEVDFWGVTLTLDEPGLYGYKFRLNDQKEYGDDAKSGGTGMAALRGADYFPLTVSADDFTTPAWIKEAIIYQIFPDRFFNGNPLNDTAKTSARGDEPLVLNAWDALPTAPALGNDADAFWNNDFFGGDLEGIRQKLDYLQSLGVTALYLNPIVSAASNHKYDASNFDRIDPLFATTEEFRQLANALRERGMYLILDGVFNHVGDDSIYFDRYGKYTWVGAYEYWSRVYDKVNHEMFRLEDAKAEVEAELRAEGQRFSPYNWHNWFTITNRQVNGRYDYLGWAGYDSLPVFREPDADEVDEAVVDHASELNNREWAEYMLYDPHSVAKRWLKLGSSGWRLDVATEVDSAFWQEFRKELKTLALPSGETPLILGETWQDASHFFLGDQFDSVMNYGFRYAVLEAFLLNADAAAADAVLQSMRQNYPKEALYALMNLIGSHDTARALYLLGGGKDEQTIAEPDVNFDYDLGKRRLKLAAIFQMGYPGAPTIYYGDETGLFGARDPDCRRPYPWGREDQELLEFYRRVAAIRTEHQALFAHGGVWTLYADGDVYMYARKADEQYAAIAINRGDTVQALTSSVQARIPDGTVLVDALEPAYLIMVNEGQLHLTLPPASGRMLLSEHAKN